MLQGDMFYGGTIHVLYKNSFLLFLLFDRFVCRIHIMALWRTCSWRVLETIMILRFI